MTQLIQLIQLILGMATGILLAAALRKPIRKRIRRGGIPPAPATRAAGWSGDPHHPLRCTRQAAEENIRHELNTELIETTLAYPAATGVDPGKPGAWYIREFGGTRIKVWAILALADQPPAVTRVEVTTTHPRGPGL